MSSTISSPIKFKLEFDSTSHEEPLTCSLQKTSRIPHLVSAAPPAVGLESFDLESSGSCLDTSVPAAEHSTETFESPEFHWSEHKPFSTSPLSPSLADYLPDIEDYSSPDYSPSASEATSLSLSSAHPRSLFSDPQPVDYTPKTTTGSSGRQRSASATYKALQELGIPHLNVPRRVKPITPHRLIEKRRRDKINSSLQQLKALVLPPTHSHRTSRAGGRLDKADILKLAIDHIKMLQGTNKENNEASNSLPLQTTTTNMNMAEEEMKVDEFKKPNNERSHLASNPVSVGQHVMLGYMDCHQEAIDFLTKQANIPEDHPLIQQLNKHLLAQQQNLDFKAIEKNLELAEELREVAERHSSPSKNSDVVNEVSLNVSQAPNSPAGNQVTLTPKPVIEHQDSTNWIQADFSLVNNSFATNNNGPIAETFVSSSCPSIVSSPVVQKTPPMQLRKTSDLERIELLPSFPVFAMQYLTSNSSQKSPAPEMTSPIFSV